MNGRLCRSRNGRVTNLWNKVVERMEYKKLWTDMHSNIHHEQMELLPEWFGQVKKIMDFWPVAYLSLIHI